jgi:hypothetical protein
MMAISSGYDEPPKVPKGALGKRICQIVKSVQQGVLTESEGSRLLFDEIAPENVAEALQLIPETFHADIRERVRQMPMSPWDWQRSTRMEFYCGRTPPQISWRHHSECFKNKPVGEALRSYYRERGIFLERTDPTPSLELSFEEVLKLYDNFPGEGRERKPLSEAVAVYVFAWRKRGTQWERPERFASDLSWCPTEPPSFVTLGDSTLGMLWGVLNCFHPWVYRDESGRAVKWAEVSLTTCNHANLSLGQFDLFLTVCRESGNAFKPRHIRLNAPLSYPEFDEVDCANSIRTGKNFQISTGLATEVLCKALLIAKKCRQDDPTPNGE